MNAHYLTSQEAAKYLKISLPHLYKLKSQNKIRAFRPSRSKNGKLLFVTDDLDLYVRGNIDEITLLQSIQSRLELLSAKIEKIELTDGNPIMLLQEHKALIEKRQGILKEIRV